jgi:hypothetical protein
MRTRIVFSILFSLFAATQLSSQTLNFTSNGKTLFRKYTGGRPNYSKVSIKFYSDSTYEYSNWYHFGQTEKDTGKYLLTDTVLILFSKGYLTSKQNNLNTKTYLFEGQQYRIQNKLLLLFTKKQEEEDKIDFYQLYFTLHRVE